MSDSEDILTRLSWYVTNEVPMPVELVVDTIEEIERLHEEINDLRLRVVSSSIPVTGPIVLIGEDGKEYVLQRDS